MMHGREKSDSAILAVKPANKVARPVAEQTAADASAAEPVERRAETKGNASQQSTHRTQSRASVSQALERIRQAFAVGTQGRSRMRESCTYGSVRGAPSNGRPYRDHLKQKAVLIELLGPVVICFATVLFTTVALSTIDSFVPTEHLMLGYLLPVVFVAIYFGSTLAVLTSFASGLATAYFLLPPKFSFYVDAPVHIAELGFNLVLAVTASKVIGALAADRRTQLRATRSDEAIE